jgi:endonuclease/exonuclease/phosphatase (EEP) superfamily protein YafD
MRHIVDLGFSDAADQVGSGWSPTWPAGGHVSRLGVTVPAFAPIDHVLTSPALAVTAARTLEVAGADHRAVLASVSPSS